MYRVRTVFLSTPNCVLFHPLLCYFSSLTVFFLIIDFVIFHLWLCSFSFLTVFFFILDCVLFHPWQCSFSSLTVFFFILDSVHFHSWQFSFLSLTVFFFILDYACDVFLHSNGDAKITFLLTLTYLLCYSGDPLTTETYVLFNTTVRLDEIRDVARRLLDQENHGCIYLEDDCVDFKVQSKISNLQGDKVYGTFTHFEIIFFHTPTESSSVSFLSRLFLLRSCHCSCISLTGYSRSKPIWLQKTVLLLLLLLLW